MLSLFTLQLNYTDWLTCGWYGGRCGYGCGGWLDAGNELANLVRT